MKMLKFKRDAIPCNIRLDNSEWMKKKQLVHETNGRVTAVTSRPPAAPFEKGIGLNLIEFVSTRQSS